MLNRQRTNKLLTITPLNIKFMSTKCNNRVILSCRHIVPNKGSIKGN